MFDSTHRPVSRTLSRRLNLSSHPTREPPVTPFHTRTSCDANNSQDGTTMEDSQSGSRGSNASDGFRFINITKKKHQVDQGIYTCISDLCCLFTNSIQQVSTPHWLKVGGPYHGKGFKSLPLHWSTYRSRRKQWRTLWTKILGENLNFKEGFGVNSWDTAEEIKRKYTQHQ